MENRHDLIEFTDKTIRNRSARCDVFLFSLRCRCSCHGTDLKNPNLPTEETCTQCHPKAMLIEKTKDLPGANPHNAPHNGDCINCHLMHEPPEDYCAQCHKFNFKVK